MTRILGFFLMASSLMTAGRAWGADTSSALVIRVVEGDRGTYAVGSRATRGITVLVTDGNGRPMDGTTVSFSLPESGPGGVFASGSRTELVTTRADGRAAAWGMQWNHSPGVFQIRIGAVKGEARGTIVSSQTLLPASTAAASAAARTRVGGGGRGHKLLWISLAAVAAGAVAGVAGASMSKSSSSGPGTTSSTASTSIGAPTITLGHP